jgi:uncharacterized coiled-coil protein SlyX
MKIQRFKQFINESEEYLDEPANEMFNEILNQIANAIDGQSGWMASVNENSSTLRIDQDWNIDDLNYEGDEPRVYASYTATFKLAFQDDASELSPELVRLWKLGLAPVTDLIKGFDHVWGFSIDSKDVPELDIQEGVGDFEFISIEDLTGGTANDLTDIEAFAEELIETLNGWLDEQTYMLHSRVQEELDQIEGRYDEDEDDDFDEEPEEDSDED